MNSKSKQDLGSAAASETPTPLSERTRIVVWFCEECGYWRPSETTGVHAAPNPDDPNGRYLRHELHPVEFAAAPSDELRSK